MKDRLNKIKENFLTGFFNGGTPFSAKKRIYKRKSETGNPLRKKADELMKDKHFEEHDIIDSVCYFGGGIIGLTIAPIDAVITLYDDVKHTFKIE